MTSDRKTSAATPARMPKYGISESRANNGLDMAHPLGSRYGSYFDGVGTDDAHDDDLGAGRQSFMRRQRLVFNGAVLQGECHLADAGFLTGHAQVDSAAFAHGTFDPHRAVRLESAHRLH